MIYFLRHVETGLIKIGCTNDLDNRLVYLRSQYGDLELLGLQDGFEVEETELHDKFKDFKSLGLLHGQEWFNPETPVLEYVLHETSLNIPLPMADRPHKRYTKTPNRDETKYTMVRVSSETKQAVRKIQARIMLETGKRLSMDKVLMIIFEKAFPDLIDAS